MNFSLPTLYGPCILKKIIQFQGTVVRMSILSEAISCGPYLVVHKILMAVLWGITCGARDKTNISHLKGKKFTPVLFLFTDSISLWGAVWVFETHLVVLRD